MSTKKKPSPDSIVREIVDIDFPVRFNESSLRDYLNNIRTHSKGTSLKICALYLLHQSKILQT